MSKKRWVYLIVGTIAMLFAGVIYAWSVLKTPLSADFGWSASQLTLNFTLTMAFFCIGGIAGSIIARKIGVAISLIISGILGGGGFVLSSMLSGSSIVLLYLAYGLMSGLGIGIAYNVLLSTLNRWFPDKKGLCSGLLMMGFGASTLIIGNVSNSLFGKVGWRSTYLILGIAIGVVLIIAGIIIRAPKEGEVIQPEATGAVSVSKDFNPGQMIKTANFWKVFLLFTFISALGNTMASMAKDFALFGGAADSLATTMVGIFAVCNGIIRVIMGVLYDSWGRKKTMICSNILGIVAVAACILTAITGSLPLAIVSICLCGLTYGSCPTGGAVCTRIFFGDKYYSSNLGVMTCNLLLASFMATLCSMINESTGGYLVSFIVLAVLVLVAFGINLSLKDDK